MKHSFIYGQILVLFYLTLKVFANHLVGHGLLGGGRTQHVIDTYEPLPTRHGVGLGSTVVEQHVDPPGFHGNLGHTDAVHTQTVHTQPHVNTFPGYPLYRPRPLYPGGIGGAIYPRPRILNPLQAIGSALLGGGLGGLLGGVIAPPRHVQTEHHVVDQHVDPPFTHGNHQPVPAVHTTSLTNQHTSSHHPTHLGLGHGLGGSRSTVVNQHVDPPFTHGNHGPTAAVHTTRVDSHRHGGLGTLYPLRLFKK
ncbi:hypothetical protein ACF0H5_022845 [Mactra antiquata]